MSSSVPVAVPAFIAIAQAALPSTFQVVMGQIYGPFVSPQSLLITGIHFNEDEYAELGPQFRHEEHYNLECTLVSSAGDNDQASRLQEVYGYYADLTIAVANNPDLSGTVRLGWTRQLSYMPTFDAKGFSAGQLNFEVEVQARVTSLS